MRSTAEQRAAIMALAKAVAETVQEVGTDGTPQGIVFTGIMNVVPDITNNDFQSLVDLTVNLGWVKRGPFHTLLPGAISVILNGPTCPLTPKMTAVMGEEGPIVDLPSQEA